MHEDAYSLAILNPDDLEEIKELEQRFSDRIGHPISLIAYQANTENDKSD
ncbi:hypothetical protein [Cohnella abietis]|uniref:Uncharacterized protein n=1 Tax=Cohnella abietis TaxID=2507935 RepID=A0A3T1DDC6_9BACL|nr:hypothetical protein [Cohnella abietis]BBI36097.1 hypothetical protein KCTCHS21_54960 [Cohnella abietis]